MAGFEKTQEPNTLDDATFNRITELIRGKCGIALTPAKKALVAARVRKRMRELQITQHDEYFQEIMDDETGVELVLLMDSIATNVTFFYRESTHFEIMEKAMRQWEKTGQKKFRMWSAACSSGEEPYTMAFTVNESLTSPADVKILATDISTKVLGTAHQGMYEKSKTLTIPEGIKAKYMDVLKSGNQELFSVKPFIREMVVFTRLNLMEMPFPMKGPMDIIFCRNVMIYFDKPLRKKLVEEFYRLLKPGGLLIIGLTESLIEINSNFRRTGPSVYTK